MGGSTKKQGFGHTKGTAIAKLRKRRLKRKAEVEAANVAERLVSTVARMNGIARVVLTVPCELAESAGAPGFVPCRKWHGQREGYCFKLGSDGVGYYRDALQPAPSDFLPLPISDPKPKRAAAATNPATNRFAVLMQRK
jgi:hypothetical protein